MLFSHLSRAILFVVFSSLFLSGCSISWSFGKSSDSLSSISNSSSGNGEKETKPKETSSLFMDDVTEATVLYVSQGKNNTEFQDNVTSIAKNHGINDWEGNEKTFAAMGKGLKLAGVSEDTINDYTYFNHLSSEPNYKYVVEGFKK